MADSPYIFEATQNNFDALVLETSKQVPVVVDFWADWCAPCKMLMPVLEKLVQDYGGKFVLVKVNSDEQQDLVHRYQVRSLPTLKLFKDGQPADELFGAQPEGVLREMLDRHIVRESDLIRTRAAQAFQEGDADRALELLHQAAVTDPENHRVTVDLARLLVHTGKLDEAEQLLNGLSPDIREEQAVGALLAQAEFARTLESAPDLTTIERTLNEDPANVEARYQAGAHKVLAGQYSDALEDFLSVLQRDRSFGDDAGRKAMLAVFNLLGNEGELVSQYRKRMFNALH